MLRSAASKVMWVGSARVLALLLAVMVALVVGYATKAYAAPGDLDPSFHTDGKVTTGFANSTDAGLSVALQEDGKIVAAGSARNGSNYDFALARYFGGHDATAPNTKAPVQALLANSTLGASTTSASVPTRISWSATDSEGNPLPAPAERKRRSLH